MRPTLFMLCIAIAGCSSSQPEAAKAKLPPADAVGPATTTSRHPYAKYLEIAGLRIREARAGKLEVKLAAVNHSEAELGDVTLKVRLKTSADGPEDPPITEFEARISDFGPFQVRDVTGSGDTKLRVYELPDWQFLRAEFDITYPAE